MGVPVKRMTSYARCLVSVSISIATFNAGALQAKAEAPSPPVPAQVAPAPHPHGSPYADADPPPETRWWTNLFIGAGVGATYGVGPGLTGMHAFMVGIRRRPLVLLIDAQMFWGGWRKPAEDTLVEWSGVLAPIALCYERRGFQGCGVYASALLEAQGYRGERRETSTLTYPADNRSWFSTAGVRAGYELRLTTSFYLRAYVDVLKTISQPSLHGGGAPIWQVSSVIGSASLYLFYTWGADHGRKPLFD